MVDGSPLLGEEGEHKVRPYSIIGRSLRNSLSSGHLRAASDIHRKFLSVGELKFLRLEGAMFAGLSGLSKMGCAAESSLLNFGLLFEQERTQPCANLLHCLQQQVSRPASWHFWGTTTQYLAKMTS